jgi:hypothetical protein
VWRRAAAARPAPNAGSNGGPSLLMALDPARRQPSWTCAAHQQTRRRRALRRLASCAGCCRATSCSALRSLAPSGRPFLGRLLDSAASAKHAITHASSSGSLPLSNALVVAASQSGNGVTIGPSSCVPDAAPRERKALADVAGGACTSSAASPPAGLKVSTARCAL